MTSFIFWLLSRGSPYKLDLWTCTMYMHCYTALHARHWWFFPMLLKHLAKHHMTYPTVPNLFFTVCVFFVTCTLNSQSQDLRVSVDLTAETWFMFNTPVSRVDIPSCVCRTSVDRCYVSTTAKTPLDQNVQMKQRQCDTRLKFTYAR